MIFAVCSFLFTLNYFRAIIKFKKNSNYSYILPFKEDFSMSNVVISDSIKYIGADDTTLDLFE